MIQNLITRSQKDDRGFGLDIAGKQKIRIRDVTIRGVEKLTFAVNA